MRCDCDCRIDYIQLLVFLPCCRHCAHPRRRCYRVTNIGIPSHTIRDRLLLIKNYHFRRRCYFVYTIDSSRLEMLFHQITD